MMQILRKIKPSQRKLFLLLAVFFTATTVIGGGLAQALSQDELDNLYNAPWYRAYSANTSTNCSPNVTTTGGETTLTGSDTEQKVWNFFTGKGLGGVQTAAIMGNLYGESGMDPTSQEDGSSTPTPKRDVGFGLAQWTYYSRQDALVAFAAKQNKPVTDLGVQLDFLWIEYSTSYSGSWNALRSYKQVESNIRPATLEVMNNYETPDSSVSHQDTRINQAIKYYHTYSAQSGNDSTVDPSTPDTTTNTNCGADTSVACTSSGTSAQDISGLSQTRQAVVCIAQKELALWKSQPGYPTTSYAQNGYLKYSQNAVEEWCADFVSWVYNQAGDPLQASPNWRVPAVVGVQAIGQKNQNFHWHPQGSGYIPKPGDLAIHLDNSSHVNIFISNTAGTSTLIGGDQGQGPYPGGSIVSTETGSGYYFYGITGYVSPD